RCDDEAAQPRLGVPWQTKEPLVPKQIVRKKCDRENVPCIRSSPRCDRQDPNVVPRMQNRAEHEHDSENPKHSALPIPNEEKSSRDHSDDQDRIVTKSSQIEVT